MLQLVATLHVFGVRTVDRLRARVADRPERGSETIEKVLWAIAVIAIVAIVVAAITTFVTNKSKDIK